LKGKAKVNFNRHFSDELSIERGVPQGETMSPFLFIIAIDPLLRIIRKDENIKGCRFEEKHHIKTLAYADDIAFISSNKNNLEKMMYHVENYCKASNAEISINKSQLISFGKTIIDQVNGIKQNIEGEKIEGKSISNNTVRHLGIYVNKDGFINTIPDILNEAEKNLYYLKFLYPNLCTKINLIKGYFLSKLNYQSTFLVINKEEIKHCENLIKWFLKNTEKDDNGKVIPFSRNKNYRAGVSLERLSRPKELGGRSLPKVIDIFSANKSKIEIKSLLPQNKNKDCYYLLHVHLNRVYEKQDEKQLYHPLFLSTNKNIEREWKWLQQSEILYKNINKTISYKPRRKDTILNTITKKETYFENKTLVELYTPETNTIPISKKLTEKGYKKRVKADIANWICLTDIKFEKWCYEKKIKRKDIIFYGNKNFRNNNRPVWTQKQQYWIENLNIPVPKLLSTHSNNISKIENFRIQVMLNSYSLRHLSCLCGIEKLSTFHILNECKIVEDFENKANLISEKKHKSNILTREIRLENQFNHKSIYFDHCWITNWSLWTSYWKLVRKESSRPVNDLLGSLKAHEQEYVLLNEAKTKNKKHLQIYKKRSQLFRFHVFSDKYIYLNNLKD